ncbi:uncharacterized protein LOC111904775 [Lactuca sativa]|uniref:uncharacterized protein LOC111904775 n=1 Tax=Lactuca sativa TaxID=4236 RepID=UPI000CC81493|nr:uncharacterized protein LOC111904775 [Lactuca sativa]
MQPHLQDTKEGSKHYFRKELILHHILTGNLQPNMGLMSSSGIFLTYTHLDAGGVPLFTCRGWDRLFRIREPVYREFLLEFYTTVAFDPIKPLNDRNAFSFQLGGVSRECSAIELAIMVGVYTADETRTPHIRDFLSSCIVGTHQEYNENTFWAQLTGEVYVPSSARGSMIRSTTYRLLHRLITSSLTRHKISERVPSGDLSALWTLITPGRNLNLPLTLALYMARKASGRREDPICGGHFVTQLAASYSLLTRDTTRAMIRYDMRVMGVQKLESMRVIARGGDGIFRIVPDDEAPEGAVEP